MLACLLVAIIGAATCSRHRFEMQLCSDTYWLHAKREAHALGHGKRRLPLIGSPFTQGRHDGSRRLVGTKCVHPDELARSPKHVATTTKATIIAKQKAYAQ